MLFISEYLDILPPAVAEKIARLDAERDRAAAALKVAEDARSTLAIPELQAALASYEYLVKAVIAFDLGGYSHRHILFGTEPAHVRPVPRLKQLSNPAAAVLAIRDRLAALDTQATEIAASSLADEHKELHATDFALARLALEREEEQLVCHAETNGVSINRRADLHPLALLEI